MPAEYAHPDAERSIEEGQRLTPEGLFEHLFGAGEGYLVTFTGRQSTRPDARPNELDDTKQESWAYPGEAAEVAEYLASQSEAGRDTYFGVHLFATAESRKKENAAGEIWALWVDGDGAQVPADYPQPTAVIESSTEREHYYWRLALPISPEEAAELNRRLTYALGADKGKWGLGTVLRAPMTRNYKREEPVEVTGYLTGVEAHAPEDIDAAIPPMDEVAPAAERSSKRGKREAPERTVSATGEPPVRLFPSDLEAWNGKRSVAGNGGGTDRSRTLHWIACGVARGLRRAGISEAEQYRMVEEAVEERDRALGYEKYTSRDDRAERYAELADEAIAEAAREPDKGLYRRDGESNGDGNAPPEADTASSSPTPGRSALDKALAEKKGKPSPAALAHEILQGEYYAQDMGGKLYHYSGGVYRSRGERTVKAKVKQILEGYAASEKWSSHLASEVVEYLLADAPELWEKPPVDRINLANGIYDTTKGKLLPHNPDFLSPIQLPVSYDPAADCPEWDRFCGEVFPADAPELAFEIPAWLMIPYSDIQRAILLLGEGGNGKSTYLEAVEAFIGRSNTSSLSLQKIEGDRFASARLVGKLANICPDLPSEHLNSTSTFKAIVDGSGDGIDAEYKYREGFSFRPFSRLIFSANHPPRSSDASHAFYRRWLVVPFEGTFQPGDPGYRKRADISAALTSPAELSGVLNRALGALPRILDSGTLTESEGMQSAHREFQQVTDPLSVWLERNTVEHPETMVAQDDLRKAYNQYAENSGKPGMGQQAFGRALSRARPGIEKAQRTWNGQPKTRVYLGIGFKGHDPEEFHTPDTTPPESSRNSRDSRDIPNCSVSQESGGDEGGKDTQDNSGVSRVNCVKPVNGVSGASGADDLAAGVGEGGREAEIEAALGEHDRVCSGESFTPPTGRDEFVKENWPALKRGCGHEPQGGCWMCRQRAWRESQGKE